MSLPKAPVIMKRKLLTNGAFCPRPNGPHDITCIVMHQTASGDSVDSPYPIRDYWNGLRSPNRTSAHYVVGRELLGPAKRCTILQCVDDSMEAYHAGEPSSWHGRAHVNGFSIGIEMVDDADGKASDSWPDHQIQAVAYLLRLLFRRHKLDFADVTEHRLVERSGDRNDVTRDFPWAKLKHYVKSPPWR